MTAPLGKHALLDKLLSAIVASGWQVLVVDHRPEGEETKNILLDTADILFDRKFYRTTGIIIGAIPILYGAVSFLQNSTLGGDVITGIAFAAGLLIWIVSFVVTKKR